MKIQRKTIIQIAIVLAAVAIVAVVLYFALGDPVIQIPQVNSVQFVGRSSETGEVVQKTLSAEDADLVLAAFNGKKKLSEGPGDVFDRDAAFALNNGDEDMYFFLAGDGSNYVISATDEVYFTLTDEEFNQLKTMLRRYKNG